MISNKSLFNIGIKKLSIDRISEIYITQSLVLRGNGLTNYTKRLLINPEIFCGILTSYKVI